MRLTDEKAAEIERKEYLKSLSKGMPRNIPKERFLKLAAYENLGVDPDGMAAILVSLGTLKKVLSGDQASNLLMILGAIAEGRVIVLPEDLPRWTCGNECFCLRGGDVDHVLILSLEITSEGRARFDLLDKEQNRFDLDMSEIGKTIFPTIEEAEKRRKELEENGQL